MIHGISWILPGMNCFLCCARLLLLRCNLNLIDDGGHVWTARWRWWAQPSGYIYKHIHIYIWNIWGISINIHNKKKKYEQKQRTQMHRLRRPPHWVCVLCFCSFIFLYDEYLWVFLIYSLYIPAPPNGAAAFGGRPIGGLCVWLLYIINIYGYISYTFLIYSIYIS